MANQLSHLLKFFVVCKDICLGVIKSVNATVGNFCVLTTILEGNTNKEEVDLPDGAPDSLNEESEEKSEITSNSSTEATAQSEKGLNPSPV